MTIEASVMLKGPETRGIGRERMRLLQAVAREGSISAGAKAVGLTYKAAWDALDAMANLFGRPLLETHSGGRSGGGAQLTPAGLRVIEAFDHLEAEMARVTRSLEADLAGTGITPPALVASYFMKTSARNVLRGSVSAIQADALSAEVTVAVGAQTTIHALVTAQSVRDLGLCVGRQALVLVKASFIVLAAGDAPPRLSARNCLRGIVRRCESGITNAEVVLDIGDDKTLAASVTAQSVTDLGLAPGVAAFALFDSSHVLIAID